MTTLRCDPSQTPTYTQRMYECVRVCAHAKHKHGMLPYEYESGGTTQISGQENGQRTYTKFMLSRLIARMRFNYTHAHTHRQQQHRQQQEMFYLAFGLLFPSEGRPHFVKFRELFWCIS